MDMCPKFWLSTCKAPSGKQLQGTVSIQLGLLKSHNDCCILLHHLLVCTEPHLCSATQYYLTRLSPITSAACHAIWLTFALVSTHQVIPLDCAIIQRPPIKTAGCTASSDGSLWVAISQRKPCRTTGAWAGCKMGWPGWGWLVGGVVLDAAHPAHTLQQCLRARGHSPQLLSWLYHSPPTPCNCNCSLDSHTVHADIAATGRPTTQCLQTGTPALSHNNNVPRSQQRHHSFDYPPLHLPTRSLTPARCSHPPHSLASGPPPAP